MLIIRSLAGEKIIIGDNICLTICEVGKDKAVRIGVEAPRSVRVLRKELLDLLKEENTSAIWHGNALDLMEMLNGKS